MTQVGKPFSRYDLKYKGMGRASSEYFKIKHIYDYIYFWTVPSSIKVYPLTIRPALPLPLPLPLALPPTSLHLPRYPPPVTCHLSPVTCHLSPVTCHLSFVTCDLSLGTCGLSFVTCYLSLVTCDLLFVTCHLPRIPPLLRLPRVRLASPPYPVIDDI